MKIFLRTYLMATVACTAWHTSQAQVTPAADVATEWIAVAAATEPTDMGKASGGLFATRHEMDVELAEAAAWSVLEDGTTVGSLSVRSAGAKSMSLALRVEALPEGGEMSVMGAAGVALAVGAVSEGETMTPIVDGEEITLLYTSTGTETPRVRVSAAYVGFRDYGQAADTQAGATNKALNYGDSGSCEVAAACTPMAATVRRSVCRLIVNNNMIGTGTLVNTTAADNAPLVLTSAHVVNSNALKSCTALFDFEEPFCQEDGYYNGGSETITGGTLVAFDAESDMAIIRLSESPTLASNPSWAGWSRSEDVEGDWVAIHHPKGDVKKASIGTGIKGLSNYDTTDKTATGGTFAKGIFWEVGEWTQGTTEAGSSGCSLVDGEGRIRGALSGGYASCSKPKRDYFWMLSQAWDRSSDGYATLGDALDPRGTGAQSVSPLTGSHTDSGTTETMYTYDPTSTYSSYTRSATQYAMAQPIMAPDASRSITIWAVRLHATDASGGTNVSTGAKIAVGVSNSPEAEPADMATRLVYTFGRDLIVDYVFDRPVTISAGQTAYIHVRGEGCQETDVVRLATVQSSSAAPNMVRKINGEWAEEACAMAMDVIYTQGASSAMDNVASARLTLRASGGEIALCGEAISSVAVYDRRGLLTTYANGRGDTEVRLDVCGMPTGLYVVRALCTSGALKSFKVIIP